ncbi:MAG: hypothetical protein WD906_06725 [Anaerolineales bacterium]
MRTPRLDLLIAICLSVLLRIGAGVYLGNHVEALPGTADQVSYHTLALRVLGGHGFSFSEDWWPATAAGEPTAHWSYLYTLYLTAVYGLFGPHPLVARLIQAVVVGVAHPLLAYKIADLIFGGSPTARIRQVKDREGATQVPVPPVQEAPALDRLGVPLLAASVTAVYAYFVYYSGTLMTEPFYIAAVLLSIYLVLRLARARTSRARRALSVGLGVSLAAAVLLRQVFLLMIPLLLVWLLAAARRASGSIRPAVGPALVSLCVCALAILPVTVFNYSRFDRFLLLNTNAGFAMFLSNHPFYGTRFVPASEMDGRYREMIPHELRALSEADLDAELLKRGLRFVIDEPARYLRLSVSRVPLYFNFLPSQDSSSVSNVARTVSFGLFLPFMLLGLARPFLHGRERGWVVRFGTLSAAVVLLYLFVLGYSLIHILSWVQVRYRLPVDAVLVIFAASGLHLVLQRTVGLASWLNDSREGVLKNA